MPEAHPFNVSTACKCNGDRGKRKLINDIDVLRDRLCKIINAVDPNTERNSFSALPIIPPTSVPKENENP